MSAAQQGVLQREASGHAGGCNIHHHQQAGRQAGAHRPGTRLNAASRALKSCCTRSRVCRWPCRRQRRQVATCSLSTRRRPAPSSCTTSWCVQRSRCWKICRKQRVGVHGAQAVGGCNRRRAKERRRVNTLLSGTAWQAESLTRSFSGWVMTAKAMSAGSGSSVEPVTCSSTRGRRRRMQLQGGRVQQPAPPPPRRCLLTSSLWWPSCCTCTSSAPPRGCLASAAAPVR